MKSLRYFQICVKVFRVVTYVLAVVMIASAIANALFLSVWIGYDDISFVNRSDFYRQVLVLTDRGSYYYNVATYASELLISVIKVTLLVYIIQFFNMEINIGNPFNEEIVKMSRWLGIRMLVFPVIAFIFAAFINIYLNQAIPVQLIDISFLAYGSFFVLLSFLLKYGIDRAPYGEETCINENVEHEVAPVDEVVELDGSQKDAE